MFNNDVTAQYTHTLTVTERLGGQYQCNVTNNKPEFQTLTLTSPPVKARYQVIRLYYMYAFS